MHGHLDVAESEQKASRETIVRLMNDQQNISQFSLEMENLRVVGSLLHHHRRAVLLHASILAGYCRRVLR